MADPAREKERRAADEALAAANAALRAEVQRLRAAVEQGSNATPARIEAQDVEVR